MSNQRDCPRTFPHGIHSWKPYEMGERGFGDSTVYLCGGNLAEEPPCTLDVQMADNHELEFYFDAEGHVSKIVCSCGRQSTVEML